MTTPEQSSAEIVAQWPANELNAEKRAILLKQIAAAIHETLRQKILSDPPGPFVMRD